MPQVCFRIKTVQSRGTDHAVDYSGALSPRVRSGKQMFFSDSPIPGGRADGEDLYELMIENDGDRDATDFRLDVEIPTGFVDGGGYIIGKRAARSGVSRLRQIDSTAL